MRRLPAGSLRFQMALAATLMVTAVSVAGAAIFSAVARREMTEQFESTMGSLAANLARNAAHGVFIESGEVLRELAEHLMAEPDVRKVEIVNARGATVLAVGAREALGGEVVVPVVYDAATERAVSDDFAPFLSSVEPAAPREIGRVRLVYGRGRLEGELEHVQRRIWWAAAAAAALGAAVAMWLADRIVRPLRAFGRATAAVAAGDLETKVPEGGGDEIAELARSFNRMIDALRASRGKLAETYAELGRKERLATLGQFTAVIAHELRNPLGVILSSAQVISNPKRTPEMKERAAQFIVEEVRRLNADVTDFLNFARPKPPEIRPTDLGEVARHAVDAWRASPETTAGAAAAAATPADGAAGDAAAGSGRPAIVAELAVEPALPRAAADPDQLHQLLLNLLYNASQAIGGEVPPRPGRIEVRVRRAARRLALDVRDDGPGIPPDVRAHLFEPFFTTKKRGSGLGLAVIDQIVRAHGGELLLDTEVGRGTTFSVLLPIAESDSGSL